MDKPLTWNKIDTGTHLFPNMTSFHVDTRNFMYMYTTEELHRFKDDTEDRYYTNFNKLYDLLHGEEEIDKKYLTELDRIIPFIFSIREITKLNEVIIAKFNTENANTWVKYLRFYPYKGKYVVTNDCLPVEWGKMTAASFISNKV